MAAAEDYVGLRFGTFLIEGSLGSGAEAEVYCVLNEATGRRYAMRLDANDDDTWCGRPVIPPRNISVERNNVRGSWHATFAYEDIRGTDEASNRSLWQRWFTTKKSAVEFSVHVVVIYGVKDSRYLVPVSDPFRLKDSISIERLLEIAPSDDLWLFELWEDVVLKMLSDTYQLNAGEFPEREWIGRWSNLIGGPILTRAMRSYMSAGTLSGSEKANVFAKIDRSGSSGPELAENIILRLCGAISRGRISMVAGQATARSMHFRENISTTEFNQMVACWNVLCHTTPLPATSLSLLGEILACFKEQPPSRKTNPGDFELILPNEDSQEFSTFANRHNLERFSLFLQELGGVSQPYTTLE